MKNSIILDIFHSRRGTAENIDLTETQKKLTLLTINKGKKLAECLDETQAALYKEYVDAQENSLVEETENHFWKVSRSAYWSA